MKIVTLDTLKSLPDGTVFCKVDEWGQYYGDIFILTGRYKDREGFNGIMNLLPDPIDPKDPNIIRRLSINRKPIVDENFATNWSSVDTTDMDFSKMDLFMIFSKKELLKMIEAIKWAIDGLTSDFDMNEIIDEVIK